MNTPALDATRISHRRPPDGHLLPGQGRLYDQAGAAHLPAGHPERERAGGPAGEVLQGVGFRGGSFTDVPDILPLASVPATEMNGVHPVFRSSVFYPIAPWSVNYYSALVDPVRHGPAHADARAVQDQPPDSLTGTMRLYRQMNFRLFYSGITGRRRVGRAPVYRAGRRDVSRGDVAFRMHVTDPVAGVQGVWVTYSAVNGPLAGSWQSLDLTRDRWTSPCGPVRSTWAAPPSRPMCATWCRRPTAWGW